MSLFLGSIDAVLLLLLEGVTGGEGEQMCRDLQITVRILARIVGTEVNAFPVRQMVLVGAANLPWPMHGTDACSKGVLKECAV